MLTGVDFAAAPGAAISVLGPNGGGKTTLMRALTGELQPLSGAVGLAGRPAYVAQSERARLDFPVSALDVAVMGTLARGRWWLPARAAERRSARAALARVGLEERRGHSLRRALRRPAPTGADRPRARAGRAGAAAGRAARRGRSGQRRAHRRPVRRARAPRAAPCWLPRTTSRAPRAFDQVLCLNRRQVAFGAAGPGAPARGARGDLRQRDRGHRGRRRAGARDRRPAPLALRWTSWTPAGPLALGHRAPRADRDRAAGRRLRRALFWIVSYPAELPGRVAGPRAAARPGAGGTGGRAAAAGRRRRGQRGRGAGGARRARRAHRRRHRDRGGGHGRVRPRWPAGPVARCPGSPGGAAVRRPARRGRCRPGGGVGAGPGGRCGAARASPAAVRRGVRRRAQPARSASRRRACRWHCWACWPPRWRWPCRGWAACWSWRCWWRRRWRRAATRQAPAPAWPSARSSGPAPASPGSTPRTTWAAPPVHRWRWRCAPPRWRARRLPGLRRDAAPAGARAGGSAARRRARSSRG